MENHDRKIPQGWVIAKFKDVALYIQRGKSPKYAEKSILPVINQQCIRWNGIEGKYLKYIHPDQFSKWSEERYLQDRDILWNSTGTGTIGRACLYKKATFSKAVVDSHVTIVRTAKDQVLPEYTLRYIASPYIQKKIEVMQSGSTNQVELGKSAIENATIPIAPLNEQKRIVDKIDLLFSDLDEGEALLKTVQKQLTTYRQSVLKAAVTGELTKDWREQNNHRLEPGGKLLQRILKSRRANWQGRGKYQEPSTPDTNKLPDLPEGWAWASFEALITDSQNGMSKRRGDKGRPVDVLRLADIEDYRVKINDLRQIVCDEKEVERYRLLANDILCIRVNGSRDLVGKFIPYESSDEDQLYCDHFIRFRTDSEFISKYLCLFSMSHTARIFIDNKMVSTAGQNTISQSSLLQMPVAFPGENEQQEILDRVAGLFSQVDALENWCTTELSRSETLRQSILKAAFSGKLVPQDPTDEPASELLNRIQANRTAQPQAGVSRRFRKKQISKTEAA